MKSQYTRKAKPEPAKTPTAIEPKTNSKLAGPRSRSTTVVVKRRNRRNRTDGAAGGATGGNADVGKCSAGFCGGGNSRGNNSEGGKPTGCNSGGCNSRGINSRAGKTGGGNGNTGAGSSGAGNKSGQLVPVRHKPLSDYMMLEEQPSASSRPTTSSSYLSDQDPPMSYAAAVESLPVSRLKVKVVLSPRLKRSVNQPPVKRPSPKTSPDTKVKLTPPTQSKPNNVQLNPRRNMAQVPPQSRVAQANPKPNNLTPPAGNNKKSKSKRSQKARQNQQRSEATSTELPVSPQPCDTPSSSPTFSDTTAYLDHYHEQMQRILAEQTAGQKPYPNRGQVKSCKHSVQLPTNRSLFDFDERLFKRGDLESAAILAQNQAMIRKWLNPSMLIS
ncbi:cell surface glycoprotein 1 isoform X1 [Drosophila santomea]|uniref:cell surface glycoprotein 1 isoform X1 n=2 Tax=Drosophila santomea TaxID=129105 RepID=UPI001CCE7ECF|nr:cell surface glycoprotein 1 isoform X1 [Drosophila santomea]